MAGPNGIGRGIEPLLRLCSDEMDNRVTHFASSLVVIKVKCEEPLFRLCSDEMDNRVTHFASSLVVITQTKKAERLFWFGLFLLLLVLLADFFEKNI